MSGQAVMIEGFQCYAPTLALGSDDYPIDLYDRLWRLEENHFWFQARNEILLQMFRQYLKHRGRPSVLNRMGIGYVLKGLAAENDMISRAAMCTSRACGTPDGVCRCRIRSGGCTRPALQVRFRCGWRVRRYRAHQRRPRGTGERPSKPEARRYIFGDRSPTYVALECDRRIGLAQTAIFKTDFVEET